MTLLRTISYFGPVGISLGLFRVKKFTPKKPSDVPIDFGQYTRQNGYELFTEIKVTAKNDNSGLIWSTLLTY